MEKGLEKERMHILEYRKDLLIVLDHSEKFVDQVIASLTVGILGFTMVFRDKLLGNNSNPTPLKVSWILLLVSVSLIVISNYLAGIFARMRLREIDRAPENPSFKEVEFSKCSNCLENLLSVFNAIICFSFLAGLGSLVYIVIQSP